ncbi:MAG: Rap1a/Tai family immunity protein [Chlorobiales bacterium]|nr:Rap1a/Tai family immunity protein [Chlorobiales bacterium]
MKRELNTLWRTDSHQLIPDFSNNKKFKKKKTCKSHLHEQHLSVYKNAYPPYLHILSSIPEKATLLQACDVVGKWLDEHPEQWNKPSYQLVIKALEAAFSENETCLRRTG